jgi:hypothetical protein
MTVYNLKRETKLFIVRNNLKYAIDLYPDLSFSQTFSETTVPVKTLHAQYDMFDKAVITKANPANFSFTIPVLAQHDLDVVLELLRDYSSSGATLNTADLYMQSNSEVYKLEKAVVESGVFQLVMNAPITLNVSGTASKLSKFTDAIPGTLQARTGRTFTRITSLDIKVAGVVQSRITSVSVELKNTVQWVDFATIQKTSISDASGTQFPGAFVVSNRVLSGTIQQYITDESNINVNSWKTSSPIVIKAGSKTDTALEINIPAAVFTNRLEVQDLLIQSYDWRMVSSPRDMTNVVKKI